MNKTRIVLYATTAVVAAMCILFAACSNDEVIKTNDNINEPTAQIQLSASMEATLTRAANDIQSTALDNASTPAVYIYRTGKTATDDGYGFENIAVTKVSSTYTESNLFYPQNKGNIDVYMYAPRVTTSPILTAMPITVATDQSGKTNYLASDFVYGMTSNVAYPTTTPSPIGVTLKHALSKITLAVEAGTGASTIADTDVTEVKLGDDTTKPYLSTTVDLTKSTLSEAVTTATSGTQNIIQFADASTQKTTVSAILPPQTLTNCPLSVKIGSATYTANLSSPTGGFEAGKEYTYTVKVNLADLTINVTSITDWITEAVTGDINVQ